MSNCIHRSAFDHLWSVSSWPHQRQLEMNTVQRKMADWKTATPHWKNLSHRDPQTPNECFWSCSMKRRGRAHRQAKFWLKCEWAVFLEGRPLFFWPWITIKYWLINLASSCLSSISWSPVNSRVQPRVVPTSSILKQFTSFSQGFTHNSSTQRNSTGMCITLMGTFSSSDWDFRFSH